MKKRILYTFLLLVFPFAVYADSIIFECPSQVKVGNSFSCDIYGNTSNMIMALKVNVATTDGISLIKFSADSGWQGGMTNERISLYRDDDVTNKFKIGTIEFKGNKEGTNTITTSDAYFYSDEDGTAIDAINEQVNIVNQVVNTDNSSNANTTGNKVDNNSSNSDTTTNNNDANNDSANNGSSTYLMGIIIDKYSLDFDKDKYNYELTIADDEERLTILPLLDDNNLSYEILGNSNLKDGSLISIVVTSDNNQDKKSYNIKIHKKQLKYINKYSIVFLIIIGILILINIFRIVSKKKKQTNGG